eukprot:1792860-Pleurochrysis_carterae.AAC.1
MKGVGDCVSTGRTEGWNGNKTPQERMRRKRGKAAEAEGGEKGGWRDLVVAHRKKSCHEKRSRCETKLQGRSSMLKG